MASLIVGAFGFLLGLCIAVSTGIVYVLYLKYNLYKHGVITKVQVLNRKQSHQGFYLTLKYRNDLTELYNYKLVEKYTANVAGCRQISCDIINMCVEYIGNHIQFYRGPYLVTKRVRIGIYRYAKQNDIEIKWDPNKPLKRNNLFVVKS